MTSVYSMLITRSVRHIYMLAMVFVLLLGIQFQSIGKSLNKTNTINNNGDEFNIHSTSEVVMNTNNIPPNITCPANITVNTACNATTATVTWGPPFATDPDNTGPLVVTSNYNSGASFPIGNTIVVYTVSDGIDANSCSFMIIVNASTSSSNTSSATACNSYTWPVSGNTYTTSGTYTFSSLNSSGCVQSDTLNLTVNYSTAGSTSMVACDSYNWPSPLGDGNTYITSGSVTNVSTNANGCPHTETLNLTINNSTSSVTNDMACDSYVWNGPLGNGNVYTSSNNSATYITTNSFGCTHTQVLNLTILHSTSGTTTATACDSYVWAPPLGNGSTYTTSNNTSTNLSTNADGCAHTQTLNLTINYSSTSSSNVAACASYTWAVNNQTYTLSGTYSNTGVNAFGCSHISTLNLTINPLPVVSAPDVSSCIGNITLGGSPSGGTWNLPNPYTGTASTYTYTYTDGNGCMNSATANVSSFSASISNITVTNITGVSASVNYAPIGGIGWFEVRWKPVSSSTWIVGTNNNSTTKALTNLTANTNYEVQVRGYCTTSTPGAWSASTLFSTNNSCGTPTNLGIINIGITSGTATWTMVASATYYSVQYKVASSTSWLVLTSNGSSLLLPNLQANALYDVRIATVCGTTYSAYSSIVNFTTGTGCGIPSGLNVTNLTATTAKLNWTAVTGSLYYNVRYKKTSASTWTSSTTTGTSKNITGLTLSSLYEFQVQTVCSTTSTSAWSASTNFSTPASKENNSDPIQEEGMNSITAYPNPTHDLLYTDIFLKENAQINMKMIDMSGRVVKEISLNTAKGENHIVLDMSDLNNGIYSVQINMNDKLLKVIRVTKN